MIKNTQPDVKTERKWKIDEAVDEAESRFKHKEMVGATQLGRRGLGGQYTSGGHVRQIRSGESL